MLRLSFTILVAALMTHSVSAREFSPGTPSMDFNRGELKIPCLAVQNSGSEAVGQYFAVTLQQRGNSMNFDVTLAEKDDTEVCGTLDVLANSARSSEPEIHLECQISEDRIRVEVEGEDLPAGDYIATLISGEVSVRSELQASLGNEVKFWFDSDATTLETDFADVGDSISASIASETLTLETEAVCAEVPLNQDDDSGLEGDLDDDQNDDEDLDDDDANDDDDGVEDQNVTEVTVNPGRGNSGQNNGNNGNSKADKANGNNGNNGKSNKN